MTPHRRRCLIKAILEIKGALAIGDRGATVTAEELLAMPSAALLHLYIELEKAFESANITEPAPNLLETTETIVMEAVTPRRKP